MKLVTVAALLALAMSRAEPSAADKSDPDFGKTTPELIRSRGYDVQTHQIETKDGYLLTTFRIVNPRRYPDHLVRPVILQHGLMFSSREWLIAEPRGHLDAADANKTGSSLALTLAQRGYDVWLPNSRGNHYSRAHVHYTQDQAWFWDFSTWDMARHDVPAVIDYVLARTGARDVAFVGHSAGTMKLFGTLALEPRYNDLVRPAIALAPVLSLGHTQTPLRVLAHTPFLNSLFGDVRSSFLPSNRLSRLVSYLFCRPPFRPACHSLLGLAYGHDRRQVNDSRFDVYASRLPAGTSTKDMLLFLQAVRTGRFSDFDYGLRENVRRYGSESPPEAMPERITNRHIILLSSPNDYLASPADVNVLRTRLGVPLYADYVVADHKFNRLDFKLAKDVATVVNEPVLRFLQQFDP